MKMQRHKMAQSHIWVPSQKQYILWSGVTPLRLHLFHNLDVKGDIYVKSNAQIPEFSYNSVNILGASPAFSILADVMMMCLSSMISSHKILRHLPTTNQILISKLQLDMLHPRASSLSHNNSKLLFWKHGTLQDSRFSGHCRRGHGHVIICLRPLFSVSFSHEIHAINLI